MPRLVRLRKPHTGTAWLDFKNMRAKLAHFWNEAANADIVKIN